MTTDNFQKVEVFFNTCNTVGEGLSAEEAKIHKEMVAWLDKNYEPNWKGNRSRAIGDVYDLAHILDFYRDNVEDGTVEPASGSVIALMNVYVCNGVRHLEVYP